MKPTGTCENDCAPVDMVGPVSMRFRPVLPTDEQAMAMIALQMVNAPKQMISKFTALKDYLQKEDPDAEIDRMNVETALEDPMLKAQWVMAALKRAGIAPPQPPQIVGPNGQPISSGQPGMDGQVAGGQPSVPGLNMPLPGQQAQTQVPRPGESSMAEHGAQASRGGQFPGRPSGQGQP